MTATALLTDLTSRGVRLWAESDRLKVDAPRGTLTTDDKTMLAEHKAELLALLSEPEPPRKSGRQLAAKLLARHECPDGCGALVLQDRALDVWFCPGCRLWVIEG